MNIKTQSLKLPAVENVPGEMFFLQNKIRMFYQGSMWTLVPDVVHPDEEIDISFDLRDDKQSLTEVETDVLRLIGRGLIDKEIASVLFKSVHTIRHQKDKICAKYGVERKRGLAALAIKLNLV